MKTRISIIVLSILILGCEPVDTDVKTSDTPVVEAFVLTGQDSIRLTIQNMIGYMGTDQDTVQQPVTDASVQVELNDYPVDLLHDENNPGSYTASIKDIALNPGDTIGMHGVYNDITFHASTVIPGSPDSLEISGTKIYYDADNPRSMITAGEISLSWINDSEDFYYVFVENIEETLVPLNEMLEDAPPMAFAPPSKSDQFRISMRNIRYYGNHQAIVYHVNPEFADLFDQAELTSYSIMVPPGNIENALGVFTAMSADTVYFQVLAN